MIEDIHAVVAILAMSSTRMTKYSTRRAVIKVFRECAEIGWRQKVFLH